MGNCCKHTNKLDDMLLDVYGKMQLRRLNFLEVKEVLNSKTNENLTEEIKRKFSNRALSVANSFLQISKENFLKVCQGNFYSTHKVERWKQDAQRILCEKIYDSTRNNTYLILLYLLPYMDGSDVEKLNSFYLLMQDVYKKDKIPYSLFKVICAEYFTKTLQIPLLALEQALRENYKVDELALINWEEAIDTVMSLENINLFIDVIFDNFETLKFGQDEDLTNLQNYSLEYEDFFFILGEHKQFLFDLLSMRYVFLQNVGV